MKAKGLLLLIVGILIAWPCALRAASQYQVAWQVMDAGGTDGSTSPQYQSRSSVGQAATGSSSSSEYWSDIGFWGRAHPYTSVADFERWSQEVPQVYDLDQNFPNPFNPITEIRYALPRDCRVRLEVFNPLGQRVALLADEEQEAGYREVTWDASAVASGIYFYRLQAAEYVETKKMILVK